jgi:hypothetical protein
MEDHRGQQEADTFCTSIDCSRESAGLSSQMEIEVKSEKMLEHIRGDLANRLLSYACENRVSSFCK